MTAYYNEIDPYCAQWLRNLIAAGHIADGEVDERSIVDVRGDDLRGFTQCHFFAGIGGWSYALRLAGWSDDRPVWTGSCPCQPWSEAGKHLGAADERHLWPVWLGLISERQPPVIFGEQVAGAPEWLRLVRGDLDSLGYALGALPIEAACAGQDQLRDRFYFVADANSVGWNGRRLYDQVPGGSGRGASCGPRAGHIGGIAGDWIADPRGAKRRLPRDRNAVVDGLSSGVAVLRAIGNAIVPQVAAEFIRAYIELTPTRPA